MADVKPGDGDARQLREYWTSGKGLAKWAKSAHPYGELVKHLEKHMTPQQAKGLAANYFRAVFKMWPGERKGSNPVGPG